MEPKDKPKEYVYKKRFLELTECQCAEYHERGRDGNIYTAKIWCDYCVAQRGLDVDDIDDK